MKSANCLITHFHRFLLCVGFNAALAFWAQDFVNSCPSCSDTKNPFQPERRRGEARWHERPGSFWTDVWLPNRINQCFITKIKSYSTISSGEISEPSWNVFRPKNYIFRTSAPLPLQYDKKKKRYHDTQIFLYCVDIFHSMATVTNMNIILFVKHNKMLTNPLIAHKYTYCVFVCTKINHLFFFLVTPTLTRLYLIPSSILS